MSKHSSVNVSDPLIRELSDIKKLLILDLLSRGVKPIQVAKMLGVDQGNFSRMYPMRRILGNAKKTK